ncbi:3'-5' exonuclease [Ramlibacter rhizophilus]|uniref:3'-5' exonuclease n=1 Tax=Ramlibacter rhizophilus TaxID=1781167 RepID=A0A4Z0BM82_9BURK|nr:3'-5' exonuclease [Ramlibacter rhizophilus]TFY99509.1 3'-5' exonuclease [Ramlibacter rhizophilus]
MKPLLPWWPAKREAAATERWLVVDVEATGLDARRAGLLAVAALGLRVEWSSRRLSLVLGDSFSVRLHHRVPVPDKGNVLVHGIGVDAQAQGLEPAQALQAFARFAAGAPLLAFHADFDRQLLARHARALQVQGLDLPWLDIAALCASAYPELRARALDDWLAHFGIECLARHDAMADVLATADLLQRIWPVVGRECANWRAVQRFAARARWLRG